MNEIRKISIGLDYKNSMHYIVGQSIFGDYSIHAITKLDEDHDYCIWIEKEKEVVLWKSINQSVPVVCEFNIDF